MDYFDFEKNTKLKQQKIFWQVNKKIYSKTILKTNKHYANCLYFIYLYVFLLCNNAYNVINKNTHLEFSKKY